MKLMIIIHYKYSSLRNRLQFAAEITANIRQLIHFLPPPLNTTEHSCDSEVYSFVICYFTYLYAIGIVFLRKREYTT